MVEEQVATVVVEEERNPLLEMTAKAKLVAPVVVK